METHKGMDRKDQVGGLLQRFAAVSEDLSRTFATRHGMHHTAARAIVELMEAAQTGTPLTAGQLGEVLGLSPASVTALVDRMISAGHVRREAHPTDRRRILLTVEPAAVELGDEFFRPLADELLTMMDQYTDQELELISRFLQDSTLTIQKHLHGFD
ncbi:hypothetical protein GCM10027403_23490 [Arthrobacter tecti]